MQQSTKPLKQPKKINNQLKHTTMKKLIPITAIAIMLMVSSCKKETFEPPVYQTDLTKQIVGSYLGTVYDTSVSYGQYQPIYNVPCQITKIDNVSFRLTTTSEHLLAPFTGIVTDYNPATGVTGFDIPAYTFYGLTLYGVKQYINGSAISGSYDPRTRVLQYIVHSTNGDLEAYKAYKR